MVMRYGIVGYNGPRRNQKIKTVKPPKVEPKEEEVIVEDTLFDICVPVVLEAGICEKRKEFIVFLLNRIKDLKDSEVKEEKVVKKKRKYRKRQKSSA